jgi:hypothetical protein
LIHIYNLVSATILADIIHAYPCRCYLIYLLTDFFVLTVACYAFLRLAEVLFKDCPSLKFETGDYGQKHMIKEWLYQLMMWLLIVIVVS